MKLCERIHWSVVICTLIAAATASAACGRNYRFEPGNGIRRQSPLTPRTARESLPAPSPRWHRAHAASLADGFRSQVRGRTRCDLRTAGRRGWQRLAERLRIREGRFGRPHICRADDSGDTRSEGMSLSSACVWRAGGSAVLISNSDSTLHNVNAAPKDNRPFNFGQPASVPAVSRTFDKPEVMVPLRCDVHGWMNAYAGVVSHPFFAVTKPMARSRSRDCRRALTRSKPGTNRSERRRSRSRSSQTPAKVSVSANRRVNA